MANKDTYVYLDGVMTVDGTRYLPGEPFEMEVELARHNLKKGVALLPATAVTDQHVAAVRANTTVLNREHDATSVLTASPDEAAFAKTTAEEVNEQADADAKDATTGAKGRAKAK